MTARPDPIVPDALTKAPARKLLAALIVIIPFAMTIFFSMAVLYHGTPEFRVDKTPHGLKIHKIRTPENPVEKGDIITRINGMDYNSILSCLLTGEQKKSPGPANQVTVLRDGHHLIFSLRSMPIPPFDFLAVAWPRLLLMLMLVSLGVISFLRVPAKQPALLFLLTLSMFATTFSATFPSHFGILNPYIISVSFFTLALCNWAAFGAYLHFVFRFPDRRNLVGNRNWLVALFYLAAPAVSLLAAWIFSDGRADFFTWLQRFRNIGLPFMALAVFIKHFVDYKNQSSTLEKNQIKLVINAFWLSFGPYLALYAVPNILLHHPLIPFRFVVISGIILPLAYFISLIRYRLLDVDKLTARTVSYFLLITLFVLSYSWLVIRLKRIFLGRELFTEEFVLIYLIVIAVLFDPLYRLVSSTMDKLFLPSALYKKDTLLMLSRRIGSAVELRHLVEILTRSIPESINIHKSVLIVFNGPSTLIYPPEHMLKRDESDFDCLREGLPGTGEFMFCSQPQGNRELHNLCRRLSHNRIELIFSLKGGTGISGLLLLGERRDGRPYAGRDIRLFTTLASQAGLALENSFHYDSLSQSKKQLEKMFSKVVQSEKMAALGEMSTILAHELKNPLGIIRSSAQYLDKNLNDDANRGELLGYIVSEVDGLESVVNNIMGLARYKPPELEPVDLKTKMPAMIRMWSRSGNHNPDVAIELEIPENLPRLSADFRQLQQVFLNCISNAEDAMPGGGKVFITAVLEPGRMIHIRIADTGTGIPEKQMDNAFKKFFTTKEKGMGIGLPVCRQIISAHNGSIDIRNRDRGGLSVIIRLPCDPLSLESISDNNDPAVKENAFAR